MINSPRAVEVSIYVVRAVVHLREVLAGHKELVAKLSVLERKLKGDDQAIVGILDAIRQLAPPPAATGKPPIGFVTGEENNSRQDKGPFARPLFSTRHSYPWRHGGY